MNNTKKSKKTAFNLLMFFLSLFLTLLFTAESIYLADAEVNTNSAKELFRKSKRKASVIYFVSDSASISADGETPATLTVLMENKKGKPLPNIKIGFKIVTGEGTLSSATAKTGKDGKASVELTSSTEGTILILAKTKNIIPRKKKFLSISVAELETATLVLIPEENTLTADGTSTVKITALLRNEKNNPISDATIEFASEKGIIPASATTDSNGKATVELISEQNFNGDVVVTATYKDVSDTVTIEFVATGVLNMAIAASPSSITVDGSDFSEITVTLTDANGSPVPGETVDFRNALDNDSNNKISTGDTLDYGTLSVTTGVTDNSGVITTTLTATDTGKIVVEANSSGVTKSTTVSSVAAGEVKSVTISSARDSIFVINDAKPAAITTTVITATFTNITSGRAVFATSLGSLSSNIEPIVDGVASVTLTSGALTGIAVVNVSYYDTELESRIEDTIDITITSDTPKSISVTSSPDNVRIETGQSVIKALVKDKDNNPVAGIEVGFTLVNKPGGTETLDSSLAVTDANGLASVTFTAGELSTFLFNGVKIDAYVASDPSIASSTYLTISGEPFHVALVFNDYLTELSKNGDGTLSCPIAALVSDIHGNPVADGTLVSFGVATTQLVAMEEDIDIDVNGDGDTLDKFLISSEDFIFKNDKLDPGEDLNGNRIIDIIEDINGNGVLDANEDEDGDGVLGPEEDDNSNGLLDIDEDVNGNGILDVNISASSIVTKSSKTTDGVATGELTYGVNFVERFQVRLTAESGGVIDGDGQYLVLPARDSNTGKNITKQTTFTTYTPTP